MILITGGLGYIGSQTNKNLYNLGYKTIIIDNLVYGHKNVGKWGRIEIGDLKDIQFIRHVFKKYRIEAVMHFAAFAYVGESVKQPQKYYLNNVVNTLNLLQVMIENGVKKIIFSSSCAIYGQPDDIPIWEDHKEDPVNPYGHTKLIIERILKDYGMAYGLKYVSLRYFNAAGADPEGEIGEWHEPETHLIPLVVDVAIGRKKYIRVFGNDYDTDDGTCIRDYIHVFDLADAHVLALKYIEDGGKGAIFNLGNEEGFSVNEIIRITSEITGKRIKSLISNRRPGDPPILIGSSEKAEKILTWVPKFRSINIIIETAWNWHKKLNG